MRKLEAQQFEENRQDENQPVRVTILYENLAAGKQAKRTYNYLVESLQGICEFTSQLWKFNLVEDPSLRSLIAQDAADADIVIVASQGENELPQAVREWFDLWLQANDHPIGLVALFTHPDRAAEIRDYLEEVAHAGGVDFFAQPVSADKGHTLNPFLFSALAN